MKAVNIPVEVVDDTAPPIDAANRLRRVRALAWFLDRAFKFGKNRRFGVEPLIGLIPGVGDWIGGVVSLYILYEGARLGLSWPVLWRMTGNILVETVIGAIPVAGDVIDFFWQANMRNVQLIDSHYRPTLKPRPLGRILFSIIAIGVVLAVLMLTVAVLLAHWIWTLLT